MSLFHCSVYTQGAFEADDETINIAKNFALERIEKEFGSIPLSAQESLIYDRLKDSTRTIAEDFVTGAQQIDHLQLTIGVYPILFLGRSPCFLKVAYEELCAFYHPKRIQEPHILHLSYSGTPDTENTRTDGSLYEDEIAVRARNLVTPRKLQFYCEYMTRQKLKTVKSTLYVVDSIGKGTSLNSFLPILRYYYEIYLKRATMPDVHFIAQSPLRGTEYSEHTYIYNPIEHEIKFKPNPALGIRPLKIKTTQLYLGMATLYLIDHSAFQDCANIGIGFPAQNWREEFLEELEPKEEYYLARGHIDATLQMFIKEHGTLYREKVSEILE
jgi:hypothetical protein